LKILMLTREYPPDVYGGAGVHVEYLTRELARQPFGLINLEAMACEVPVVASAVGGIPEVVVDGETGRLIPVELVEHAGVVEPRDPQGFAWDLAQALNALLADPGLRRTMGIKGRQRAEALFSWAAVARRTLMLYQTLVDSRER
jgi:starch synthase